MTLKNAEQRPSTASPPESKGVVSTPGDRSFAWTITIIFGVIILLPSLMGFVIKFGELLALTNDSDDGGFAITPVVNYLLASLGFFLLLLWAAFNGMFRDLERPKYLMLDNERELDAHG
jgi:hypothetical protein